MPIDVNLHFPPAAPVKPTPLKPIEVGTFDPGVSSPVNNQPGPPKK